jgi:N6-L-threonylcarbamoyladenine synthase
MGGLPLELCFSFSGLKTALLYYLKDHPLSAERVEVSSIAASYQEAIVDALLQRTARAVRPGGCLTVGGGVSLNRRLRERLKEWCEVNRSRLLLAEGRFCADNAAMIAGLAGAGGGLRGEGTLRMDVDPNLEIGVG